MKYVSRLTILMLAVLLVSACDQLEGLLAEPAATVEPTPAVRNVSAAGELVLVITSATDEFLPDGTPPAPEGQRWVVVNASIINSGSTAVSVLAESLSLLDAEGQRYVADAPDETVSPALIGGIVPAQETLRGLARFAVPQDVAVIALEWCTDAACSERLLIELPVSN